MNDVTIDMTRWVQDTFVPLMTILTYVLAGATHTPKKHSWQHFLTGLAVFPIAMAPFVAVLN